jgi:hypothetical protein
MLPDKPIRSCCSRPQFNRVGGVDDDPWGATNGAWSSRIRRIREFTGNVLRIASRAVHRLGIVMSATMGRGAPQ